MEEQKVTINPSEAHDVISETSVQENNTSTVAKTIPFYKKNKKIIIAVIVAIIILGGAGGYYVYNDQYARGGVVAIVNGKKIYRDTLNENIERMRQVAKQQGADVTDPAVEVEIQTQSLQGLIDNALLMSVANEMNITITEEEVQKKYDDIVTQLGGEEAFNKRVAEANLTIDEVKKNIRESSIVDKYFEETTDIKNITVTDEDITNFLSTVPKENLPPIEEIRPQIEAQIKNQKQQEIIDAAIAKLKESATIVKKI